MKTNRIRMAPKRRRRRYHGLYYHSSPPKILPMNGHAAATQNGRDDNKDGFVVKPSNIRIWIHDKDVGKLTRVLWAGQGNRLRSETSTNPKVRRFLENVPSVMNVIKNVHQAVIDNNSETLRGLIEDGAPPSLITTKDINGLNVMHKAAGLGHATILDYLLNIWPNGITVIDVTGKTPLHWAASAKNNLRCYQILVDAGGDEDALDYRMKTPLYYKSRPNDIDRSFLSVVPEAPRVPLDNTPDWSALVDDIGSLSNAVVSQPVINRRGSESIVGTHNILTNRSRIGTSIENISEPDFFDGEENNLINEHSASTIEIDATTAEQNHHIADLINDNNLPRSAPQSPQLIAGAIANDDHDDVYDASKNVEDDLNGNIDDDVENDDDDDDADDGDNNETNDEFDGDIEEGNNEEKIDNDEKMDETKDDEENVENDTDEIDKIEENDKVEVDEETNNENDEAIEGNDDNKDNNDDDDDINQKIAKRDYVNESFSNELPVGFTTQYVGNVPPSADRNDNNDKMVADEEDQELNAADEDLAQPNKEIESKDNDNDDVEIVNNGGDAQQQDIEENENNEMDNDQTSSDKETEEEDEKETHENETEKIQRANNENHDGQIENHETDVIEESDNLLDNKTIENGKEEIMESDNLDSKSIASGKDEIEEERNEIELPGKQNGIEINDHSDTIIEYNLDDDHKLKQNFKDENNDDDADDDDDQKHNYENDGEIRQKFIDELSPPLSQPLEYEGLVQGEPDDNQVQSQSAELDDEEKIKEIIDSGNMEQIAALVLNGEGKSLIGMKSDQPEIQAFLDNIPVYMNKIRRVHQAAKDGNIRELQAALDRRKFAIAKDEISPHGATPLHVATIFGHAGIVRHLAGRFPETTTAVDENGRTALHYAATVNDNGHFYTLLVHFGSNSKATDKLGHTPEFYRNQDQLDDILSHKQLLKSFGANEHLETEMLNDQVNRLDIPLFQTEQGRYLSSSKWLEFLGIEQEILDILPSALGEPLINGLTEIVDKRPADPIKYLIKYLQDYVRIRDDKKEIDESVIKSLAATAAQPQSNQPPSIKEDFDSSNTSSTIPIREAASTVVDSSKQQDAKNPFEETASSDQEENSASPIAEDRDEHGQNVLHFACAESHPHKALYNRIAESHVDITSRDELYRTPRDIAMQANRPANAKDIDCYVISLAAIGDIKPFEYFAVAGYDHILDVSDEDGNTIFDVVRSRGHSELHKFFEAIREFEQGREELHAAIREGDFERVQEITAMANATILIKAKNYYGRTSLHIAVLKENVEIVEYLIELCPDILQIGDNLERTALHYAMGINIVESMSRILIKNGAKRTAKDLRGRQPTYYFMNKSDILRLQEEEEKFKTKLV